MDSSKECGVGREMMRRAGDDGKERERRQRGESPARGTRSGRRSDKTLVVQILAVNVWGKVTQWILYKEQLAVTRLLTFFLCVCVRVGARGGHLCCMQTCEEAELHSCRCFSDFYKLIFVLSIQARKSVHANVAGH